MKVGLNIDFSVYGLLADQGDSGYAFCLDEGWFELIREGSVSWDFQGSAQAEVAKHVHMLVKLFHRALASRVLAIRKFVVRNGSKRSNN